MNSHCNEDFQDPIEFRDVLDVNNEQHKLQEFDQYEFDVTFDETNCETFQ